MSAEERTVARLLDPNRCKGWRYCADTLVRRPCYALHPETRVFLKTNLCDDCFAHARIREEEPVFAV